MNRRRLITKLGATLCALPLIGKLFSQRTLAATNDQRDLFRFELKNWESHLFFVPDFRNYSEKTLRIMSSQITSGFKQLVKECKRDGRPIEDVSVDWHTVEWQNRPDRNANANRDFGFFRIVATRRRYFKG